MGGWIGGESMKVLRFIQSVGERKTRRSTSNILNFDEIRESFQ